MESFLLFEKLLLVYVSAKKEATKEEKMCLSNTPIVKLSVPR